MYTYIHIYTYIDHSSGCPGHDLGRGRGRAAVRSVYIVFILLYTSYNIYIRQVLCRVHHIYTLRFHAWLMLILYTNSYVHMHIYIILYCLFMQRAVNVYSNKCSQYILKNHFPLLLILTKKM